MTDPLVPEAGLAPGGIHLWWTSLAQPARVVQQLLHTLSPDEQERAASFRHDLHRGRFVVGRGTLRAILSRYTGVAPAALRFAYGENGKPALALPTGGRRLCFNVSHSDDHALLAFAYDREIGVDLERMRPLDDAEAIAERFFSPEERQALRNLPPEERLGGFYRCWTRKEAVIKAVGGGLAIPLDSFTVTLGAAEPPRLLRYDQDPDATARWCFRPLPPLITGYEAALVCEGADGALFMDEWRS